MKKPMLFIMFGLIGSGKSYFASQLAAKDKIVWLNSDALRAEMYEDPKSIPDGFFRHHLVFAAMKYAVSQVLASGNSAIYDVNNNKARKRRELFRLAEASGAAPIVIRIITPEEVAQERALTRKAEAHNVQVEKEHIESHKRAQQIPDEDEPVITIDGLADFDEQYRSFHEQLKTLEKTL
jgi:predicted kinase